jgi:hypothetical protein
MATVVSDAHMHSVGTGDATDGTFSVTSSLMTDEVSVRQSFG